MKSLLAENCFKPDTVLFDLDGSSFTLNMFYVLLRDQRAGKSVKNKVIKQFGTRFDKNQSEVIEYLKDIAQSMLDHNF